MRAQCASDSYGEGTYVLWGPLFCPFVDPTPVCFSVLLCNGEKPQLSCDDITSLVSLYKASESVKKICKVTGFKEQSVQQWVKRYCDGGECALPTPKTHSGRSSKTSPHIVSVIGRQDDKDPKLSAHEVKNGNPILSFLVRSHYTPCRNVCTRTLVTTFASHIRSHSSAS